MKHVINFLAVLSISLAFTTPLRSQDDYRQKVEAVGNSELAQDLFEYFETQRPELIQNWKEIARIYAPSGNEVLRAEYISNKFRAYGLEDVHIDKHGNAIGVVKGVKEGATIAILGLKQAY